MPRDMRGGHPTWWTTFGTGRRRALLIHCSLAHSGAWNGVAAALETRLHMHAFDLPGHGRSADWTGARDMGEMSTAMAAEVIGHDGPMDVIGHSFGAVVAMLLAIEHPRLVRSLTMIESVFVAAAMAEDPALAARESEEMSDYRQAVARGDAEAAARAFMRDWGDGRPWSALPEAQRAEMVRRIHLIEANAPTVLEDRPGIIENRRIEGIAVPALLIRGAESAPIVEPIHAAIARRLQDVRSIAIPGARHMVPLTHPQATADAIRNFLDAVPEEPQEPDASGA